MDETGVKLARASLGLFSKEMSPEYERVHALLLGHLAAHGATVEQLARQEVNDRRNVDFLSQFGQLLPYAIHRNQKWRFETHNPMLAKTLHSHVVWIDTKVGMDAREKQDYDRQRGSTPTWHKYKDDAKDDRYYAKRPYFVLGKGVIDKQQRWLLVGVGHDPCNGDVVRIGANSTEYGEPFLFTPDRKSRKRISKLEEIARSEFPGPDDMRTLFDLDRHTLTIDGYSAESLTVRSNYIFNRPSKRISDVELGQLDVNSHLDRLATELGITQQLDELLKAHT